MPFEIHNASATFQSLMNSSFADMIDQFVTVHLDDILVYSETEEGHLAHLKEGI